MKAIILTGGLGTRLRSVVPDLPKPMAPIQDKPFLAYLLRYLQANGFTEIVLSVYYLKECIQEYFQDAYAGMKIHYAVEETPLGTGGAILHSIAQMDAHEPVFVLNGDTFVTVDYQGMYAQHIATAAKLTVLLRQIADCSRYGKVLVSDTCIQAFTEKGEASQGLINAGVYLFSPALLASYSLPNKFSFENDFLHPYVPSLKPHYFNAKDYFIDIGIPEDYARANKELASSSFINTLR